MIYYLVPIILSLTLAISKQPKNELIINFLIIIAAFIFCFGYMTGSDWSNYEVLYNEASLNNINEYYKEQGFYFLILIFKNIGFGFFPFLILVKLIVFFIYVDFLKKNSTSFLLSFFLFLTTGALFIFIDNPLRFMIALGCIILAYNQLLRNNKCNFFLYLTLASLFHISSIVVVVVYIIQKCKLRQYLSILIYIALFIFITPKIIDVLISNLPFDTKYINFYYLKMFESEYNHFTLGKVINLIFFITIITNRKQIISLNNGDFFYKLTIFYFYLSLLGFVFPTIFRLKYFFAPFYIIILTNILIFFLNKYKILLTTFLILIFSTFIKEIYSTYVYIPYSNYIFSLFTPKESYQDRVNYNKLKYYERSGKWPSDNN